MVVLRFRGPGADGGGRAKSREELHGRSSPRKEGVVKKMATELRRNPSGPLRGAVRRRGRGEEDEEAGGATNEAYEEGASKDEEEDED